MKIWLALAPEAEVDVMKAAAFYETTGSAAVAAKFVVEFKRVANVLL